MDQKKLSNAESEVRQAVAYARKQRDTKDILYDLEERLVRIESLINNLIENMGGY